mmetsp:Transcript_52708/g.111991  ORF Transcript_52708/g.111991 Transcript_52708/m.111991 type:complete len:202 (-) Transcript_52708:301-906(-)
MENRQKQKNISNLQSRASKKASIATSNATAPSSAHNNASVLISMGNSSTAPTSKHTLITKSNGTAPSSVQNNSFVLHNPTLNATVPSSVRTNPACITPKAGPSRANNNASTLILMNKSSTTPTENPSIAKSNPTAPSSLQNHASPSIYSSINLQDPNSCASPPNIPSPNTTSNATAPSSVCTNPAFIAHKSGDNNSMSNPT